MTFSTMSRRIGRARRKLIRDERGMTLLELLIVMVILGLLATLGSVQLIGYLGRAKTDTARLQINEIATALDLYRIDVGRLPTTEEGLKALLAKPATAERWGGPYLKKSIDDPWQRPFQYRTPGEKAEYDLVSYGSDGRQGGSDEASDISINDPR